MTRRAGIMLAYPFEERRLTEQKFGWTPPYLIQPKLDGDRCRALIDPYGNVQLLSSEEHDINLPHIIQALQDTGLCSLELDGELYRHELSHEQIRSRVGRSVNPHEDECAIQLHVFDIISPDSQAVRLLDLAKLRKELTSDAVQIVPTEVVSSISGIMKEYERFMKLGYEGFILRDIKAPYIRKRSTMMLKYKPRKSDYYLIVGSLEEVSISGHAKGTLGALVLSDGTSKFNVGTGFTQEQRVTLWSEREQLPGKWAHVQFQALTDKGKVPRFPVFVEITAHNPELDAKW